MHHRPRLRLAAWLALVAMLASLALPAHATAMRLAKGVSHGDLCVGGKLVPSAPADVAHDCDACGGSTASAPPATIATLPAVDVAGDAARASDVPGHVRDATRTTHARAPPR